MKVIKFQSAPNAWFFLRETVLIHSKRLGVDALPLVLIQPFIVRFCMILFSDFIFLKWQDILSPLIDFFLNVHFFSILSICLMRNFIFSFNCAISPFHDFLLFFSEIFVSPSQLAFKGLNFLGISFLYCYVVIDILGVSNHFNSNVVTLLRQFNLNLFRIHHHRLIFLFFTL